jgi:Poly (ADP-ribose) glycohydrolase (PARG)
MQQEQIRFMINPELVGAMLFITSMEDNEAIEVVGVERYIQYTGLSCMSSVSRFFNTFVS